MDKSPGPLAAGNNRTQDWGMRLVRGMECRVSKDPATSTSNMPLQSCDVEPGSWSIAPNWAWPAVAAAIASRSG